MIRVLISSIGGDVGYGIIKSLLSTNYDLYLVGIDIVKYNYSYDLVNKFVISPQYSNEKEWLDFILTVLNDNRIDYFWVVSEPEIKIVNSNRELFKKYKLILNDENVLNISLDKWKTSVFLNNIGIDTPITYLSIKDLPYSTKFPLIVKEKSGFGSHAVRLVNSYDELDKIFHNLDSPIIQEYIGKPSDEYTMTVFSNKSVINYIAFRRILGFGGLSRYIELVKDEELKVLAYKIAKSFKLFGSINVQMRKEKNKYYVFEINPRISSTIGFRLKLEFNDVKWWLDSMLRNEVKEYSYPTGMYYGVRNVEEKIFKE